MTIATLRPRTQTFASTRDQRARNSTIHIGTFADGQRAVPLTVTWDTLLSSGQVRWPLAARTQKRSAGAVGCDRVPRRRVCGIT